MPFALSNRLMAGLVITLMATGYVWHRYREQQLDRLYAAASGAPPAFQGVEHAQAAVRKLGTYRGDRSTVLLMNIALGRTQFPWPDIQGEAMKVLGLRGDAATAPAVASMLQPHVTLPVRQAAAEALRTIPCADDCVTPILHYLERAAQGELNYEDRGKLPEEISEAVKSDLTREQEAVYQTLYSVLRRESPTSNAILQRVYGVGTDAPSKVGLAIISRMQFREACAAVLESKRRLSKSSAEFFLAPREELEETIKVLRCP